MNKITPIALIVTGGLSASANAAIVTQTFNVLPSSQGVDITIGNSASAQYTYQHVVKPAPEGGTANEGLFLRALPTSELLVLTDGFPNANSPAFPVKFEFSPQISGSIGLRFQIGDGTHYGVANFGSFNEDGLSPLVDIQYDDVAAAVPEPAAWAMLIGGFGVAGAAARRSRRREKLATA